MTRSATPEEAALRGRVVEQVLSAVENRWIERCIRRAAETGQDPVKAARQAAGTMGYGGRGGLGWSTTFNGIRVRTRPPMNEIEFVIPWREVAETALGTRKPQQMSLF